MHPSRQKSLVSIRKRLSTILSKDLRPPVLLLSVLAVLFLAAPETGAQSLHDPFLELLTAATVTWADYILNAGFALRLYGACFVLQLTFIGYRIAIRTRSDNEFPWAAITRQLGILAFAGFVLLNWPSWGATLQTFFINIGKEATDLPGGVSLGSLNAAALGMFTIFLSPKFLIFATVGIGFYQIFFIIFALGITFALAAVGIRAVILTIESYILVTIGPVPFALVAWHPTSTFADNYLRYAARLGIEYMLLLLFISIGADLGAYWEAQLDEIPAWNLFALTKLLFSLFIGGIIWAWSAIRLPIKVANELVYLWRPGLREGMKP